MKEEFINMISANRQMILKICRFYSYNDESMEDLYQEILLNLWKGYPKFYKNPQCKPSTWLYRVALNTVLSNKRKQHNDSKIAEAIAEANSNDEEDENKLLLYELICSLNIEEQALIYLYLDGHSHHEIAETLGISISNVGTKIQRIKIKIKNIYNQSTNIFSNDEI